MNIERGTVFSNRVEIGSFSGIGVRAWITGKCTIGNNVMMGPDCIIFTSNHNFSRIDIPMIQQGMQKEKPVSIGDDVWIGARVTILPGVKIGSGVVIGTVTVASKDVPDCAVVVGNPMRIIKKELNQKAPDKNEPYFYILIT